MHMKMVCLSLFLSATGALGQFSDTYQKAAQAYENAAAQCQSPAGASCMRQNATYYSCLASQLQGGGGCGAQPSCSTACTSSGPGVGSSGQGATGAGLSSKQQLALTGLSLALNWLSNRHHHSDETAPQAEEGEAATEAQREADDAAVQAAIAKADQASSELANERAALTSGADPSSLGGLTANGGGDPSVALRNQFTGGDSVPAATSQQVAASDPSDQMAQLRAQMTAQAQQEATASQAESGSPPPIVQPPVPANLLPQDQEVNAALQESVDQPDPSQAGSLAQMFQSTGQEMKDGLDSLVTSGKTLTSNLMNDPVVQWAVSDRGSLSTIPPPEQGDSPDTATNKVYGQAVVGFRDLIKGIAGGPVEFAKALYGYGTAMVDQMGADLGLASGIVFETPPGGSQ
jgi:hypothetical protein